MRSPAMSFQSPCFSPRLHAPALLLPIAIAAIATCTGSVRAVTTPFIGTVDSASVWSIRNSLSTGGPDVVIPYGGAGQRPIVGDWNGDGFDGLGVYVPSTGAFFLRDTRTPGPADLAFSFGGGGSLVPLAGDYDGNGTDTIGLYNPATGTFFLRNSNTPGAAD